uniref:Uncharacterized protein n=1 Tax=Candidatus Methanogaster sp. ANME-2c ERB4 TaxID=2759911 RepID=A0A7G9Y6S8_9EURY|nr:hypothetical protein EBHIHGGH_00002 [Methanosarcinales archaeon ANME-2c ERB4]QNO43892.1 hypothetical protein HNHCPBFK_00022 [Methanosarcinales archaeon ANME-2c ERB4]
MLWLSICLVLKNDTVNHRSIIESLNISIVPDDITETFRKHYYKEICEREWGGLRGYSGGGSVVKKEVFSKNPLAYILYCVVILFKPYVFNRIFDIILTYSHPTSSHTTYHPLDHSHSQN